MWRLLHRAGGEEGGLIPENSPGTPETTADYITTTKLSTKSSKIQTYHTNYYPDTPAVCSAVGLITAALL